MRLDTTRFGPIEIQPDQIITLTQPILGFQEYRRFVLLDGPGDRLHWLQSTESGELAFVLLEPRAIVPDYSVQLSSHELSELAVANPEELDVYVLLVIPKDPAQVRANLKAPILINTRQRLGKQTILDRSEYPIQYYLTQARQSAPARPQEISNARADA